MPLESLRVLKVIQNKTKFLSILNVVETVELSKIVHGSLKWYNHFGKYFGLLFYEVKHTKSPNIFPVPGVYVL